MRGTFMDNQDKTTFSLDDDEIVEEEVIDRDEEYDDGYEDEYDDDYDDYGDEEYDEGYDDEYDDYGDEGYNDDYYDDRLTKVLDELAELKRGMVPATQQQSPMPIMPPQYIYQPTAPPAGSEVVMYNEISRLRDELARNQNSLEMQKELQRIKEDMARDQKFAEAQYQAEIQRLQSKIDDLLKNGLSPQDELPEGEQPAHLEGGKSKISIDKLLSVNEAILRTMREGDARLRGEIDQLKKQFEDMPSVKEINDAVSAVKKVVNEMDDGGLTKLSSDLSALKSLLEGGAPSVAAQPASQPVVQPVAAAQSVAEISAAELLRQLYEIKTVIGNTSPAAVERAQTLAELVSDYKKVAFDVHSQSTSYKDKLNSVYSYVKRLADCNEPDVFDLLEATDALIKELGDQPLDKQSFTAISEYCAEHGMTTVTSAMRDSADRFFNLVKKISGAKVESYSDYLPDLVSALNTLQNNKRMTENSAAVSEITSVLLQPDGDKSAAKDMVARLVNIKVADVVALPEVDMPKAYKPSRSVNDETLFTRLDELKTAVLDRPPTIIPTSGDGELSVDEAALQQILYAVDDLKNRLEAATGSKDMSEAMEELRNNYLEITNRLVEVSEKLQQPNEAAHAANAENAETAEAIVASEAAVAADMSDEERQIMLDDLGYIRAKLDDYEALLNNIADLRSEMSTGMGDGAENSMQMVEQTSTLMGDITAQLDKLYEDLTNVVLESETNIINRLGEGGIGGGVGGVLGETDNSSVLAETQAIRDSLAVVNDAVLTLPTAEALEQLRADLNSFMDMSAANSDAAAADRQRILDDIAFLREQAEAALAEGEPLTADPASIQDPEKLISYLNELSARVAIISTVADDTAVTKETITAMADTVAVMSDNVTSVSDSVAILNDNVVASNNNIAAISENMASMSASVSAVNENVGSIVDNVAAMSDSVVAMGDNVAVVSENISVIGENVATVNDNIAAVSNNIATVNDNIAAVNNNVAAIGDNVAVVGDNVAAMGESVLAARDAAYNALDALAPISEQLGTILEKLDAPIVTETETTEEKPGYAAEELASIRDNTLSILDSIAVLPLSEDVVLIRDNVAALHESVNALTESVAATAEAASESQTISEEVMLLRETVDGAVADVKQILERMSQYEQTALDGKQEIIDTVSGIREEIHINTLDEGLSASGLDAETRDALLGEIAEIRERLVNIESTTQAVNEGSVAAIDNIAVQIATLQSTLEGSSGQVDSEAMQTIVAEISAIREKLDTPSEYDTVEEILSLRDDIKAARIVDQDEVSSELEAIKNELAAISSGNMLDEIRALREDIANIPAGEGGAQATDGEINLVLNEIVSLRDEVFAFKDEVLNATAGVSGEPASERPVRKQNPEEYASVLDEITELRADQSALSENIDQIKELLSRRAATVSTEDGVEAPIAMQDVSAVLEELINLKNDIDRLEESLGGDRLVALAESVDDIRAVLDEVRDAANVGGANEPSEDATTAVDLSPVMEQLQTVNAALEDIKNGHSSAPIQDGGSDILGELYVEIEQIKSSIAGMAPVDYAAEIAEMRAEIETLRAENAQLRADSTDVLSAQIDDLKDTIRNMMAVTATTSDNTALIDEIRDLKAQLAINNAAPAQTSTGLDEAALQEIRDMLAAQAEQHALIGELGEIRDEIAQLRSLTTVAAESGESAEVQSLRNELADIKAMLASPDSLFGVAEDVTAIKADVQTLKDEPDLGVMSEILALRDEFQALREQIEDVKRIADKADSESNDSLMSEVQSLRDQLFAISMANVNDPVSGESNYESYNNIILDELSSLRDQISAAGSANDMESIAEEVSKLKAALDRREDALDALSEKVAALSTDVSGDKILEELESLRSEMSNQHDADLATLNFMSEMAHLVERQNQYLTENAGANITDELERLKAELASGDAVAEEVAKLREVMTQSGSSADNETILAELADLKEELSKEKPSQENVLILDAISRLRDEITALAEREQAHGIGDDDLSGSLSDLKEQLSEIAGIVEPEQPVKPKQPAKKPTTSTGKKRGRKPGQGQKSSAKTGGSSTATSDSGKKPAKKTATKNKPEPKVVPVVKMEEQPTAQQDYSDLEALIDQQAELLGGDDDLSLNPTMVTADAMDLADKLAKQVANKLIMEQLVEQLGDGGVSEERVDEILRDILPQEFTTIAETEASDKVRRLANQLVLNKLRSRLNGNRSDDD